jgi:hypothetical protein
MDTFKEKFVEYCISEWSKDDVQTSYKENILDPTVKYIGKKIWPYILFGCFIFVCMLIIFSIIIIILINMRINRKLVMI